MNKEEKINLTYNIRTFFRRNRTLRLIMQPVKHLQTQYINSKYMKSDDAASVKSLKNKYYKQKCCIIGNGPSLTVADLEKINCISFGSNYIYKIFNHTSWRPDFYCCFDNAVLKKIEDEIPKIPVNIKFIDYSTKKLFSPDPSIIALNRINKFTLDPYSPQMAMISEDIDKYLGCCYTVTAECIQLAIYMGFKEIYLVGVDHGFSTYYNRKGKLIVSNKGNGNHFYKENKVAAANAGCPFIVERGYELCKELAKQKHVKIYNLSRTTNLEIFEKRNFEDYFKGNINENI